MMKGNAGVTVINNVAFIFMPFGELVPETSHASLQNNTIPPPALPLPINTI